MKFAIFALCLVLVTVQCKRHTNKEHMDKHFLQKLGAEGTVSDLPDMWYSQKLDHFSSNPAVWNQRYFVNKQHWIPDGPIFLFIEGEGQANAFWATNSSVTYNAELYHGTVLLLEHRFYGKSQPLSDWSVDSLRYLSSQQALADAADFVTWYKVNTPGAHNSKVISFGGSYAGTLSAWARLKYPNVFDGSISSSGPVQAILDFTEYHEVIQTSLGADCSSVIHQASELISKMPNSELHTRFTGCKDFNTMNTADLYTFYDSICGNFDGVVQYNNYNSKSMNIPIICGILTYNMSDPLDGYVKAQQAFMEIDQATCIDNDYTASLVSLKNIVPNFDDNMRQWSWQSCTEFGFFQSANESDAKQPFASMLPLNFYLKQMCDDAFGSVIRPHIDYTNTFYGAKNVNTTRIYFVNGSLDPWHSLSVLKQSNKLQPVLMIDGHSHCSDLHALSEDDDNDERMAHIEIAKRVAEWLAFN